MPITDQYWQYAKEALLSACDAKADDDRQGLLELARTWTLAALVQRQSIIAPARLRAARCNGSGQPPSRRNLEYRDPACDAGHSPEGFTWRIAIIESVR